MKRRFVLLLSIAFVATRLPAHAGIRCDVDGDYIADLIVYRNTTGVFYAKTSSGRRPLGAGWTPEGPGFRKSFGLWNYTPMVATLTVLSPLQSDIVSIRPGFMIWHIAPANGANPIDVQYGHNGDSVTSGGVFNTGYDDPVVYRPSTRTVFFLNWANKQTSTVTIALPAARSYRPVTIHGRFRYLGRESVAVVIPYVDRAGKQRFQVQAVAPGVAPAIAYDVPMAHTATPLIGRRDADTDSDLVLYSAGAWFTFFSKARGFQVRTNFGNGIGYLMDIDGDFIDDLITVDPATFVWRALSTRSQSGGVGPAHMTPVGGHQFIAQWGLPNQDLLMAR